MVYNVYSVRNNVSGLHDGKNDINDCLYNL